GVQLDGADPEVTVVERILWPALDVRIPLRGSRARLTRIAQHHVVAKTVVPRLRELLENADRLGILSWIVDASQSPAIGVRDGTEDRSPLVGAGRCRDRARDETLRIVDEYSGRRTRGGANDSAASRIRRRRGYSCEL